MALQIKGAGAKSVGAGGQAAWRRLNYCIRQLAIRVLNLSLSSSAFLENCTMAEQSTTKRNAEVSHHGREASATKKLQKASSQPALNSPLRLASVTALLLSESPFPQSLASNSSIKDSQPSAANHAVAKSSASTTSIEKSSQPRQRLERPRPLRCKRHYQIMAVRRIQRCSRGKRSTL